jgi:hypothetical protein
MSMMSFRFAGVGRIGLRGDAGVGDEFLVERFERRIPRGFEFAAQPREQVTAPVGEVADVRRHAVWVQRDAERVRGRRAEFRRDTTGDVRDAAVCGDDVPVTVDNQGRIGLVGGQKPFERLPDRRHLAFVERALPEGGGVAGRQEKLVAVTQRNVEALREVENHFAARPGAPCLDEAEMSRRDRRSRRNLELTEVPPLPPLTKQHPRRRCALGDGHARTLAATPRVATNPAVDAVLPHR